MAGSAKIYIFLILAFIIALYIFAITAFIHPADYSESDKLFARCDACHPENADTIKSGEHYTIKCAGCHNISDFQDNRHNSTIPLCSDCHAGARDGKLHTKSGHSEQPSVNDK